MAQQKSMGGRLGGWAKPEVWGVLWFPCRRHTLLKTGGARRLVVGPDGRYGWLGAPLSPRGFAPHHRWIGGGAPESWPSKATGRLGETP